VRLSFPRSCTSHNQIHFLGLAHILTKTVLRHYTSVQIKNMAICDSYSVALFFATLFLRPLWSTVLTEHKSPIHHKIPYLYSIALRDLRSSGKAGLIVTNGLGQLTGLFFKGPEASVTNNQYTLRDIPQKRRTHLHCDGTFKSRKVGLL
jgi:hypothetical protein